MVRTSLTQTLRKSAPVVRAAALPDKFQHRVNVLKKQVVACSLLGAGLVVWNQLVLAGMTIRGEVTTSEAPPAETTATYSELLKAGDEYRAARKYGLALTEYAVALTQADNNTERALALGKEGMIYVYDQKEYAAARHTADAALQLEDTKPIAQVTALKVLAECQTKVDKNNAAAAETIERALKLKGVDWAKPHLSLKLGDCYRFSGKVDEAVATYKKVTEMPMANPTIKAIPYLNIGTIYQYNLQDFDKAKAAYANAAQLKPDLKKEIAGHLAKSH